jgi:hypothetical protein
MYVIAYSVHHALKKIFTMLQSRLRTFNTYQYTSMQMERCENLLRFAQDGEDYPV